MGQRLSTGSSEDHPTDYEYSMPESMWSSWRSLPSNENPTCPPDLLDPSFPLVAVLGADLTPIMHSHPYVHFFRVDGGRHLQQTPALSIRLQFEGSAMQLTVHRGRPCLAVGGSTGGVLLIDLTEKKHLVDDTFQCTNSGGIAVLQDLRFGGGADAEDLIAIGYDVARPSDVAIGVWNKGAKDCRAVLRGHPSSVTSLSCVPSKGWLVSGSPQHASALAWDLEKAQIVVPSESMDQDLESVSRYGFLWNGSGVTSVGYWDEHRLIFSTSLNGVKMFAIDGLMPCVRTFRRRGYGDPCFDGRYFLENISRCAMPHPIRKNLFFVGCEDGLALWDIRREDRPLGCAEGKPITQIIPLPSAGGTHRFATLSLSGKMELWNTGSAGDYEFECDVDVGRTLQGHDIHQRLATLQPPADDDRVIKDGVVDLEERVSFLLGWMRDGHLPSSPDVPISPFVEVVSGVAGEGVQEPIQCPIRVFKSILEKLPDWWEYVEEIEEIPESELESLIGDEVDDGSSGEHDKDQNHSLVQVLIAEEPEVVVNDLEEEEEGLGDEWEYVEEFGEVPEWEITESD